MRRDKVSSMFCRLIVLICIMSTVVCQFSGSAINSSNTSLSKDAGELLTDIRWFFTGIEHFCIIMEDMLPKVNITTTTETTTKTTTTTMGKTTSRQLNEESSKLNILLSLRDFFRGLKEISRSIQRTFTEEHMRQLEQLKGATDFVHEQLSFLRAWLVDFRAWITQLFRLYNYYVPEVLLGKCVAKYMRSMHPDSLFYEYPLLLLSDMFNYYVDLIAEPLELESSKKIDANETISMEQNEIPHTDTALNITTQDHSFFSLNEYFQFQNNANNNNFVTHPPTWQSCLKMYTVECVARKLKTYFIDL